MGEPIDWLRTRVPGIPANFGLDPSERLFGSADHATIQAIIMAVMNRLPHLSRSAFNDTTTVRDLVAWLEPSILTEVATAEKDVERPRGSYMTAGARLRPIQERDVERAYLSSLNPRSAHRWRFRGRTPSPEEFRRSFFSPATLVQFAVVPTEAPGGTSIGLVSSYDADLTNGWCSIAFQRFDSEVPRSLGDDVSETRGLMIDGLLILIQYLFDHFTFRKLYVEVPEYNLSLFEHSAADIFQREGELRNHFYFGDRFWSQCIFALYRDAWDEVAEPFRGRWPNEHFTNAPEPAFDA